MVQLKNKKMPPADAGGIFKTSPFPFGFRPVSYPSLLRAPKSGVV